MVLRLSQQQTSSSLQTFVSDPNITSQQKLNCLKLLKIILNNLTDPTKVKDKKYRQLRLENDKIKQKLASFPSALAFLTSASVGFVQIIDTVDDKTEPLLRIEESVAVQNLNSIQSSLQEVIHGIDIVTKQQMPAIVATKPTTSKMVEKLSEKQKARILLEQKEKEEKAKDKEERAKNVAMLKQDKHVRQNDPNWKSGVSAACSKSGTGISTFRDRYGE